MNISKYNIISKIQDLNEYFIINVLSGNADILTADEYSDIINGNYNDAFIDKGYFVDSYNENKLFKRKYLDFIDARDRDEIQIFFVPTYACNFKCSYCYQSGYSNDPAPLNKDLIDSFFKYIELKFNNRRKYITLFGGEPLLNNEKYRERIEYFTNECTKRKLELAIVTNGYFLDNYISLLKKAEIREIQVTLDGTAEMHNKRRFIVKGEDTFKKISNNIDLLLSYNIPVNLRVVVDRENFSNLIDLARFAIEKGWTKNQLFKTQIGRNYELHYCQTGNNKLFTRIELYKELYHIVKKHPEFTEFHKPAFSISKYLFENGKLPDPLFDSCPGCKTEWAFDYTGKIYSCTATVGKDSEVLGTYYPEVQLDVEKVEEWEQRDILSIKECKNCELQLACGGGCASIAKNNNGMLHSPDCRPVKELLEMGIAFFQQ